jgi:hypothetical protein
MFALRTSAPTNVCGIQPGLGQDGELQAAVAKVHAFDAGERRCILGMLAVQHDHRLVVPTG